MTDNNIYTATVLQEYWRTSDEPIGKYIINEDFFNGDNADIKVVKDKSTGKPVGHAIFQSGGVRNRNGRIYVTEDLDREIHCSRTLELLRTKNLFCEAGHPIDTSLQRQSTIDWRNSNSKILTLDTVGNNIEGNFTPSNTDLGKAFEQDLLEGTIPAWSLRALGSIRQTRLGAQVTDLRFITYDQVIYPSHSNAYMTELLKESTTTPLDESASIFIESNGLNRMIPINEMKEEDDVKNFIMNNSNNLKYINDYFGTKFESVTISPKGSKVLVSENGTDNKISVNLEYYIHNELMNYVQSMNEFYNNLL